MLNINQVRLIKENIGTMSINEIAEKFNVHRNAIVGVISNIKNGKEWTPEQDDFIIKNKDIMTCNEMSKVIGKSIQSILQRMGRLNIKKGEIVKIKIMKERTYWNKDKKVLQKSNKKGKTNEEMYGYERAKQIREKQSKTMKRLFKEGKIITIISEKTRKQYSERMKNGGALKARESNRTSPNKPERLLIDLIEKNNLPFNYVGDGKIWFKGETQSFNPDFLSKNPKHIIELFGDYWHSLPEKKVVDKERLETYHKLGYKTLVIWEHELKDIHLVLNKINGFIKQ